MIGRATLPELKLWQNMAKAPCDFTKIDDDDKLHKIYLFLTYQKPQFKATHQRDSTKHLAAPQVLVYSHSHFTHSEMRFLSKELRNHCIICPRAAVEGNKAYV
jgi:hypothetical protein